MRLLAWVVVGFLWLAVACSTVNTPVLTPTPTPEPPTLVPTDTPIPTLTPTPTFTPLLTHTPIQTPTSTPTPVPTPVPTDTPLPTSTPVPTPTPTPTPVPTPTPTATPVPTPTPTVTPIPTPTPVPVAWKVQRIQDAISMEVDTWVSVDGKLVEGLRIGHSIPLLGSTPFLRIDCDEDDSSADVVSVSVYWGREFQSGFLVPAEVEYRIDDTTGMALGMTTFWGAGLSLWHQIDDDMKSFLGLKGQYASDREFAQGLLDAQETAIRVKKSEIERIAAIFPVYGLREVLDHVPCLMEP